MHRIFGLSLSKLNLYPNDDVDIVFWMLNLKIDMLGYVNVLRSALFHMQTAAQQWLIIYKYSNWQTTSGVLSIYLSATCTSN